MKAEQSELLTDDLDDRIDAIIEQYEDARSNGPVSLDEFLPSETDPFRHEVTIELLRVDLQHSWRQEHPRPLSDYLKQFPDLLEQPEFLSQLSYEDYRMRRISGQHVSPADYAERYAIDTDAWPELGHSTLVEASPAATTVFVQNEELTEPDTRSLTDLEPGDRFENFLLLHELGRGAFARVFLAVQTELAERYVVLKISGEQLAAQCSTSVESQYLSQLQHTNIVPIYSIHQDHNLAAICMPYFGACTLRDVVSALHQTDLTAITDDRADVIGAAMRNRHKHVHESIGERFSDVSTDSHAELYQSDSYIRACTEIAVQIARGLSFAHKKGFVHRDLKPANVLLSDQGTVMLLDFNLSDHIDSKTNQLLGGTLPYLAPEHLESLLSNKRVQPTADVYSLGVILFELLTGKIPFPARTTNNSPFVLRQMIHERMKSVPDVRKSNPTVSPGLAQVVSRLLAVDCQDRYQNATEVHEDLTRHLQDRPLVFAPNPSRRELFEKWCRRHPKLTSGWTVGLCALLLLGLAIAAYSGQTRRLNRATYLAQIDRVSNDLQRIRSLVTIPSKDDVVLQDGLDRARTSLDWFLDRDSIADDSLDAVTLRAAPKGLTNSEATLSKKRLKELLCLAENAARDLADVRQDPKFQIESARYGELSRGIQLNPTTDDALDPIQIYGAYEDNILAESALELVEELESYRESNPHDLSAWILLGNAYARVGRMREAEACYSTCAVTWPDSFLPRLLRGNCRAEMKEYSDAEADFTFVLDRRPTLTSALINRAAVRNKLGLYKAALTDLDQALEFGNGQTRIHFMRGDNLIALGKKVQAEKAIAKGLELTPQDEKSWIRRGLANVGKDDTQALADFRAALHLNPFSYAARTNAVYVLAERQQKNVEAIALLDEAIKTTGTARDRAARAVYHARNQNYKQAFDDIQFAMEASNNSRIVFQAACVYALAAKEDAAHMSNSIDYLAESIRRQPLWVFIAASDPDLNSVRETNGFQAALHQGRLRLQTPPE